jgi:hypothetical protein
VSLLSTALIAWELSLPRVRLRIFLFGIGGCPRLGVVGRRCRGFSKLPGLRAWAGCTTLIVLGLSRSRVRLVFFDFEIVRGRDASRRFLGRFRIVCQPALVFLPFFVGIGVSAEPSTRKESSIGGSCCLGLSGLFILCYLGEENFRVL